MRDMIHKTPPLLAAAMMAHEANREYCRTLGDYSQVPWDEASQAQKDSIQAGVIAINENPDLSPEASHGRWLERKEREGWAYGADKSEEHMTHPCFMPYDALPDEQRFKDTLFGAVVRAVLFGESGATSMDQTCAEPCDDEDKGEAEDSPREALAEAGRVVDAGEVMVKQVMGAANYGDGIMAFFTDGSTQKWTRQGGWVAGVPVPETFAAHLVQIKADLATDPA